MRATTILASALVMAASTSALAQEQPWSFGQLLRSVHATAYASPGICAGQGEIALYLFNATGRHPLQPAVGLSDVTYSIIGLFDDGRTVAMPEDQNKVVEDNLPAGDETIRCVTSAARAQGATRFAIIIQSARVGG